MNKSVPPNAPNLLSVFIIVLGTCLYVSLELFSYLLMLIWYVFSFSVYLWMFIIYNICTNFLLSFLLIFLISFQKLFCRFESILPWFVIHMEHIIRFKQNILNNLLRNRNLHHEFSHKYEMLLGKFLFKSYSLDLPEYRSAQSTCFRSLCFQQGKVAPLLRNNAGYSTRAQVRVLWGC